jgi:predicted nucleic acid-binding protein
MSDLVIFDTSVLVDDLRTGCYRRRIETLDGLLRNSAVVLAELSRGIAKSADREFLRVLRKNHPILTPTEKNWLESGEILGNIQADLGYTADKLHDLHFDVLIALTARSHGARLITSNGADFEMIHRYRKFQLEIW